MNNTDKPTILVVDDEPDIRGLIKDILEDEGYQVTTAENGETARTALTQHRPDLILLDIWMPDIDGITLLKEFKQQDPHLTIVMMSGHGTIETAVEATRLGACDFIEKPLSMAKLLHGVEVALENQAKQSKKQHFETQTPVGKSPQIILLLEQAQRVAKHTMPILLLGESGTGKHCFARYLHSIGQFSDGKFIELTAETFPLDSLKLSALVNNTCLYIDDVALLSHKAQMLFLHMLESNKLDNCQLICASQHSLEQAVNKDTFEESLLYQLNSITLAIPPLRDHIEDIPELVHHFVDQFTTQADLPYRHFTVAAQNRLRNHPWSGNVLELRSIIQRLLLLGESDDIEETDIALTLKEATDSSENTNNSSIDYDLPLREAREQFERIYLLHQLQQTDGNVGKAAKLAGMERTHLYRKLRSLDIDTKQL
ncbi:MAG: sigma-54-dependent Fis family transcriptional regulator [Piscirickettsiaceae bacterium]|nr:sigma-54-dependent Fis family transcriptional regulator [Piscirickettsiaceae bacterium]